MASNTMLPNDTPRRANVPREVPVPVAAPVAEAVAAAPAEEAPRKAAKAPKAPKAARPAREDDSTQEAPRVSWSLFSLLDRMTSVDGLFREGLPVHYLPKMLFVMGLTLLYIGNTHYGNRMNRNIQRLKQETEDLRADYTTLKSDYMEASKQSEVAHKVAALGLMESTSPPFRITVPAGHLEASELELMPVLTADTLAARAARDSAAVHLADSLAGRHRYGNTADDTGPEIIAPPQPLDGDSLPQVATVVRPANAPKSGKALTSKTKNKTTNKPRSKKSVQKSTKQHKSKPSAHGSTHSSHSSHR